MNIKKILALTLSITFLFLLPCFNSTQTDKSDNDSLSWQATWQTMAKKIEFAGAVEGEEITMTEDWVHWPMTWNESSPSLASAAFLNDYDIDARGYIRVNPETGDFELEDGTPIKFWGSQVWTERACPPHGESVFGPTGDFDPCGNPPVLRAGCDPFAGRGPSSSASPENHRRGNLPPALLLLFPCVNQKKPATNRLLHRKRTTRTKNSAHEHASSMAANGWTRPSLSPVRWLGPMAIPCEPLRGSWLDGSALLPAST